MDHACSSIEELDTDVKRRKRFKVQAREAFNFLPVVHAIVSTFNGSGESSVSELSSELQQSTSEYCRKKAEADRFLSGLPMIDVPIEQIERDLQSSKVELDRLRRVQAKVRALVRGHR